MKKAYLPLLVFLIACNSGQETLSDQATEHEFPSPVDTSTRTIEYQVKQVYEVDGVFASNDFPAARLNNFERKNDSTYLATISPENAPINHSPWYAFKIWSAEEKQVYVELNYTEHFHRYPPKVSSDGNNWMAMDSTKVMLATDSVNATMKLNVNSDTLWVAAQEIQDHKRVGEWVELVAGSDYVTRSSAGNSVQERELYHLSISKGDPTGKPAVVIISRQHPPEVTGYFAMKVFVETILEDGDEFLEKYRVLVYPMLNPDGVDNGHFRHNTGGVDLNRDWSVYNQPEIKQIANHIVKTTYDGGNDVVLGLDFHSTWEDVYYTFDESLTSKIDGFTEDWLGQIQEELMLDDINEQPSGLGSPVSKGWFYQQFKAESITYEIGDKTPRDFIKTKGQVSARAMMDVLMK